jgi:hypothetical protein
VPPESGSPHAVIEPSVLRAAKDAGGAGAPSGSGYTKIYSTRHAFAALKADGSITAWGNSNAGGTGAPSGAPAPPKSGSPHAVIEPSALRAAKAFPVE